MQQEVAWTFRSGPAQDRKQPGTSSCCPWNLVPHAGLLHNGSLRLQIDWIWAKFHFSTYRDVVSVKLQTFHDYAS